MKKTFTKAMLLTAVMLMTISYTWAQIPAGYYDALRGKKGAELKTAAFNIIKDAKTLAYGSGMGYTWWGFYYTDNDNGNVIDRYSNDIRPFNGHGSSVEGTNIEHSFPKSWWGGEEVQGYRDLHHLMPSEKTINQAKGNWSMGKVQKASTDNGCTKVGASNLGFTVWEPNDKWKGDFARVYMYMVTAYQDYTWTNSHGLNSLENNTWPTLKKWAYTMYIDWAKADPVSTIEVDRNNAVYAIQGNRNPFIDFPNLMEYTWGDSINFAFDPAKTATSEHLATKDKPFDSVAYIANLKKTDGGFTPVAISGPEATQVWVNSSKFGWKGTSFIGGKTASESYLYSPEINLMGFTTATLKFSHALNYCSSPASFLSVEVVDGDTYTALNGIVWPAGNSWDFNDSGAIDLTPWVGKKIKIGFHYTSNTSVSPTWEIRDMTVTGTKVISTGINTVNTSSATFDANKPYKVYDLNGRQLPAGYQGKGIVIVRQGQNTWKIIR